MPKSPWKSLLLFISHDGPVTSPHPAYWAGVERQYLTQPPDLGRAWMVASELSTAQALRKRMRLTRSLRKPSDSQAATKLTSRALKNQKKKGAPSASAGRDVTPEPFGTRTGTGNE